MKVARGAAAHSNRISKEEQFIRQLTLTKTVMLSGVFFCAAKDLNLNDVRDSDGEILRLSPVFGVR
jgi:hypothetical protein